MSDASAPGSPASTVKPGAWYSGRSLYRRPLSYSDLSLADPRVVRTVQLVSREAELLDRKAYGEWQELYSPDALYIIPIDPEIEDFASHLNMVYDDDELRRARVVRLTEGYAIAAVDAAATARTLGRFVVGSVSPDGDEIELRASQVLIAYKRGIHRIWAGEVEWIVRLGDSPDTDRIARKVTRLVDSDAEVSAAGFLL